MIKQFRYYATCSFKYTVITYHDGVEQSCESMWKTELRDYTFHSEECYENYLMLIENPEYNFGVQLANSKDKVYSAISNSITGIDTASVALDRISDTINNIAENLALGN